MKGKFIKKAPAALAVLVCMVLMALPVMADAEAPVKDTGTLTVNNVNGNDTSFLAYRLFEAKSDEDETLHEFRWPDDAVKGAVLSVLKDFDDNYDSENAQDAAVFIADAEYENILRSQELLNQLAYAVKDTDMSVNINAGEKTELKEGYWLIVTDGSSVGVGEAGTSPVFVRIGAEEDAVVSEKTSIPTISKLILDDSRGVDFETASESDWTKAADAERLQSITQKVTGTAAGNLHTFGDPDGTKTYNGKYYYEFSDTLSEGLSFDSEVPWKVYVYADPEAAAANTDGIDVTDDFSIDIGERDEDGKQVISVACDNILKCSGAGDGCAFVLCYNVYLNENAVIGPAGNPNEAKIVYSSNPDTDEKSMTPVQKTYLYSFRMDLDKKDADTNDVLKDAEFIIRAVGADGTVDGTASDDSENMGKYVLKDGSYGTEQEAKADPFVTDADGEFSVEGLDKGTYEIIETVAPSGYRWRNASTFFRIDAEYDDNGNLINFAGTVFGNDDADIGIDTVSDDGDGVNIIQGDENTGISADDGLINVTVGNIKKISMPLSGMGGITIMITAGFVVFMMSALGFIVFGKRKKDRKDETE